MSQGNEDLTDAIRCLLTSRGVRSARVVVEMTPDNRRPDAEVAEDVNDYDVNVIVKECERLPMLEQRYITDTPPSNFQGVSVERTPRAMSNGSRSPSTTRRSSVVLVESTDGPGTAAVPAHPDTASVSGILISPGHLDENQAKTIHDPSVDKTDETTQSEGHQRPPPLPVATTESHPGDIPNTPMSPAAPLPEGSPTEQLSSAHGNSAKLPSIQERADDDAENTNDNLTGEWKKKEDSVFSRSYQKSSNMSDDGTAAIQEGRQSSAGNSKMRLQELLKEQELMEQQSLEGLVQHEKAMKEAEKYLEGLRAAIEAKAAASGQSVLPPISSSTSVSSRPASATAQRLSSRVGNDIKVTKFTLPQDEPAKAEVVGQLLSSAGGTQHVSSKDKFASLLRDQQKLLRKKEEVEQEYKKLLQKAVSYHENSKDKDKR
ncbi:hypothetical protein TRVL_05352 [Trypanosoma vivax]|nr:hypothetical protein TRVL_05352 [Trypanosoma vivax]